MSEQEEFEFRRRLELEAAAPKADARNRSEETLVGILRGAAGIGNVILSPMRATVNKIAGTYGVGQGAADFLNEMNAAPEAQDKIDGGSNFYKGGKLAAEIGMTLPVGGAVAQLGRAALPASVQAAPWVANALEAIGTSGMRAGSATGPANMLTRAAGGAVAGGASAGLVDPSQAGTGAVIGGALPIAAKVAGMAGNKVGSVLSGPVQSADMQAAIGAARANGYVIPPTQAKPTLANRMLEGFSGKITTAQNASAKNQAVTAKLANESLGLAPDVKITPEVLNDVRAQAGQAFEALRNTGTVKADQTYDKALDAIVAKYKGAAGGFPGLNKPEIENVVTTLRQPLFSSDAAVDAVRVLREKADAAYGAGDKGLGKAIKEASLALEDQLERHLAATGQAPDAVQALREARQLIAKTYSVEKALNPTTGAVDARKLAAQLAKGKPLSGGLKDAAEFAGRFPKAAQTVEGMGSLPQTSPLDWAVGGSLSAATANPLAMLGVVARPAARAVTLSPLVQNRLVQGNPNALQALLANSDLAQLGYRAAPTALSAR